MRHVGQVRREQRQQATALLRVMHDRADDANADVVVAVLSSLEVPTHTPELAASSAAPAAGGGEGRERRAEPMLS